jgi:hypothetical protein
MNRLALYIRAEVNRPGIRLWPASTRPLHPKGKQQHPTQCKGKNPAKLLGQYRDHVNATSLANVAMKCAAFFLNLPDRENPDSVEKQFSQNGSTGNTTATRLSPPTEMPSEIPWLKSEQD